MDASWPEKVVVIEPTRSGYAALLRGILVQNNQNVSVKHLRSQDVKVVPSCNPDLVFWVLNSTDVKPGESLLGTHKLGPDIKALWHLIESAVTFQVHLLVPNERFVNDDSRFTAVDTVAMALSGVSGIWEGCVKLFEDFDKKMIESLWYSWKSNNVFLYGEPAAQLYDFHLKITAGAWPTMIETDGGESYLEDLEVKYCFETAVALASLTIDEMRLDDKSTSGMDRYAWRLLELEQKTAFVRGPTVISRALRRLDRGWAERIPNHNVKRRNEMPIWARQDGFPARLPPIRGCDPHEVSEQIHRGLLHLDFQRDWEPGESAYTTIVLRLT